MSSLGYCCFRCRGPVGDNFRCSKCSCVKCGNDAPDGSCYWCEVALKRELNSIDNSQSISEHSPQPQPSSLTQHKCFVCGDPLGDNSLCERCFCKGCGSTHGLCVCCNSEIENTLNCPNFQNDFNPPQDSFWQEPCYQNFNDTSFQNMPNDLCECCGGPHNGGNCPGCSMVESGNGFVYDQNPYSYHETTDFFDQPPQHQMETYSCEYCGGSPHPGFDCQTGNTFVYEQVPCNQNFGYDHYPYNSPNQSQQYYCCEYCGGPHYSSDCQTRSPLVYEHGPCDNHDYSYHDQPPQYQTIQTQPQPFPQESFQEIHNIRNDLLDSAFENVFQKFHDVRNAFDAWAAKQTQEDRHGESMEDLLAIERATHNRFLFNKACMLDDDDDDEDESAIPLNDNISQPSQSTPEDSLIMGDEHLSTVPEKESDEFIKSSAENLVPTPSESEEIFERDCDSPIFGESLDISEVTSGIFSNTLFEFDNDCFSSNVNPLFIEVLENDEVKDSNVFDNMTSIVNPEIQKNILSPTYVTVPFGDRPYIDFAYVVRVFLPFFSYKVDCPSIHSLGSEDKIFDPGISHSFKPGVSHRSGAFEHFNVYPNILNESPMEIFSSTCSPKNN